MVLGQKRLLRLCTIGLNATIFSDLKYKSELEFKYFLNKQSRASLAVSMKIQISR